MASAWGKAWGKSFGAAWGSVAQISPPARTGAGYLQGLYFSQPRPKLPAQLARQRHRRDEVLWLKA